MMLAYDGSDLEDVNYDALFDSLAQTGSEVTFDAGSPMLTARGIFPYTYGARFAGKQWLSGQSYALDALFEDPPASSLEVMLAGEPLGVPRWNAFEAAPAAPLGYRLVSDDVAGAWVVFGVMAALAVDLHALPGLRDLAEEWRGDRFWVYENDAAEPSAAAIWAVDWAGASAASRFAARFAEWAPEGAATRVDAAGATTRILAVEHADDLELWASQLAFGTQ
jgi:hypothetical protein